VPPSPPSAEDLPTRFQTLLLRHLSGKASINLPSDEIFKDIVARWSDHTATNPAVVMNVASEEDISAVVSPLPFSSLFLFPMSNHKLNFPDQKIKFSTKYKIPFLAQAGGHSTTFSILILAGKEHIIINLHAMNQVNVDLD
jgi:hypothetical protein